MKASHIKVIWHAFVIAQWITMGFVFQDLPAANNMTIKVCYPFPEEWGPNYPKVIVLFRFACYYAIPLFIIGIFYVLIAKHLIHSHVPGEIQGSLNRQVITNVIFAGLI